MTRQPTGRVASRPDVRMCRTRPPTHGLSRVRTGLSLAGACGASPKPEPHRRTRARRPSLELVGQSGASRAPPIWRNIHGWTAGADLGAIRRDPARCGGFDGHVGRPFEREAPRFGAVDARQALNQAGSGCEGLATAHSSPWAAIPPTWLEPALARDLASAGPRPRPRLSRPPPAAGPRGRPGPPGLQIRRARSQGDFEGQSLGVPQDLDADRVAR